MTATTETPVAIIGMACFFPGADDLRGYWANICNKVDSITDVPASRWNPDDYFDADPQKPDHTYSHRGAFLSPVAFPPLEFGITPNSLEATDTTQLLGLLAAKQALDHAGYGKDRAFDRNRVSVILGVTGSLPLVIPLGARLGHPLWRKALKDAGVEKEVADDVVRRIADSYVGWHEESFPGLLGNVAAGRIANRLNLGGTNCVVDAACASSLGALHLSLLELTAGRCDMALSGGVDTFNDIFMYVCFSKTPALSPTGDIRPFDANGNGTILGEGAGCLVLKRLADAERDGDTVYAVLRSIGTSSDGKGQSVHAPSPAGQKKALQAAYHLANVTPDSIELVEGHGTGTKAGDAAEVAALTEVYRAARPEGTWCALGSVKSQIGHTKAAAGVAGLLKAVMALHHKVLPPTIKVEQPLESLQPGRAPFYVNSEKRPWLPATDHPRRAAVSSFGFGGSNFHCVLEEYRPEKGQISWDGETEIAAFSGAAPADLQPQAQDVLARPDWQQVRAIAVKSRATFRADHPCRLIIVLHKRQDRERLARQVQAMWSKGEGPFWNLPEGVFFGRGSVPGKLGMIFPGQGSQYVGMLRDLACQFPAMLDTISRASTIFGEPKHRLSDWIYPQTIFDDDARKTQEQALRATEIAQPALGAVSLGAFRLLRHFGLTPDAVAGHSFGELTALCAADWIGEASFHQLARERGRLMAEVSGGRGGMAAVRLSAVEVEAFLQKNQLSLTVANKNAPQQTVVSGRREEIDRALSAFATESISAQLLSVGAAFHSPLVEDAVAQFANFLREVTVTVKPLPVFSNTTGQPYPSGNADEASRMLANQLARPVEFVHLINNMYAAGIRTFVEVGPGNKLTGLVRAILDGRPHQTLAVDASTGKLPGIADLAHALAHLVALGYPVQLARWEEGQAPDDAPAPASHTIALSGANYTAPKPPRPPAPKKQSTPAVVHTNRTAQAINQHASDESKLESLRLTEEGLRALQKLSEQTAELHSKFLQSQDRALQVFQALLTQQPAQAPEGTHAAATHSQHQPVPAPGFQSPPPSHAIPERKPPSIPAPSPAPPMAVTGDAIPQTVLEIVAAKTGYPQEMLELNLELDADLGIDSIKRVEIFSALQERLPHAPPLESDQIGSIRTLADVMRVLSTGVPKAAAAPAPLSTSPATNLEAEVLEVIAAKTGYPVEILEPDMALDADLGIDSIKRVEIFSALQERLPDAPLARTEQLGGLRTIREVLEHLCGVPAPTTNSNGVRVQQSGSPTPVMPQKLEGPVRLQRHVLGIVREEGNGHRTELGLPSGAIIGLVGPQSEWTSRLAEELQFLGYQPEPISLSGPAGPLNLRGLVLLPPKETTDDYLLQIFSLLQVVGPQLRRAAQSGPAFLVTVSQLDGSFGLARGPADSLSGGLSGFAKTLSWEWPEICCKAVDLSPELGIEEAVASLVSEMLFKGPLEVGITPGARWSPHLAEAPLVEHSDFPLKKGDVVLVTGGARGVTAEVVAGLARRCSPTLVLLGRSPLPDEEPAWLASLTTQHDIKRGLLAHSVEKLSARDLDDQYRRIVVAREIRHNLDRFRQTGAAVDYRQADVRNGAAIGSLVREIRGQTGPIKGLIHGAGVIADRRLEDKTTEQFRAVYDTKVAGLRALLHALETEPLRVLTLFSSATARFGRAGQVDYAVANEVVNKIAQQEARQRPGCRVVSVNWGPWAGGMIHDGLKTLFEKEGVSLIPLAAGADYLLQELSQPAPAPVEVVIFGERSTLPAARAKTSLLSLAFTQEVSVERIPVLKSHVLKGRAVLPVVLLAEWLAQATIHANPGLAFHGLDEFRIYHGITLDRDQSLQLRLLTGTPVKQQHGYAVPVEAVSTSAAGKEIRHAAATAIVTGKLPPPPAATQQPRLEKYAKSVQDMYQDHLFHGADLRGVLEICGLSDEGFVARVRPSPSSVDWIQRPLRKTWLLEPLALDCAFQLMVVWCQDRLHKPSLPTQWEAYRQYCRSFPDDEILVVARIREVAPGHVRADLQLLDGEEKPMAEMRRYECVLTDTLKESFRDNLLMPERS